jgi:RNA polymerase sigma-70 factor (ECF subfamily)
MVMEETALCSSLNQAWHSCPEVLGAIYTDHYRHVLQVCLRFFRRVEDAEDAAAEVFLKLPRVLHQKNHAKPFRPWVSQVAGRHCIDKLRRRKRERSACIEGIEMDTVRDSSSPSPLSQVLSNEELRQLREQLNRLPKQYRVPLVLRYYRQMSYPEIARRLNRRIPAVKMLIFRAKNRLRRNLKRLERPDVTPL